MTSKRLKIIVKFWAERDGTHAIQVQTGQLPWALKPPQNRYLSYNQFPFLYKNVMRSLTESLLHDLMKVQSGPVKIIK